MQTLGKLDEKLLLLINGLHTDTLDFCARWLSDRWIWIPLYAWLLFLYYRIYGKKIVYVVLSVALLILLSDQTASGLLKNFVMRPRPCHVPGLAEKIHLVDGYCGGAYGFVSSHSANTFGLAVFFAYTMGWKHRWLAGMLFVWSGFVMLSRVYMGVHYPGDVLGGALVGFIYALLIQKIFRTLVPAPVPA